MSTLSIERKAAPYPYFPVPSSSDRLLLATLGEGWMRWQNTREQNPFTDRQSATGYEGYYVGLNMCAEEIANHLAQLGAGTLNTIHQLHRHNWQYLNRVWKVAQGEVDDLPILTQLNAYLMMNVGRLRVQVHPAKNQQGDAFRRRIAQQVQGQRMEYYGNDYGEIKIAREYALPLVHDDQPKLAITPHTFNATPQFSRAELQEGYIFLHLLGRTGYPLLLLEMRKQP